MARPGMGVGEAGRRVGGRGDVERGGARLLGWGVVIGGLAALWMTGGLEGCLCVRYLVSDDAGRRFRSGGWRFTDSVERGTRDG